MDTKYRKQKTGKIVKKNKTRKHRKVKSKKAIRNKSIRIITKVLVFNKRKLT